MKYYDISTAAEKLGITRGSVINRIAMHWYPSRMVDGHLYVGLKIK